MKKEQSLFCPDLTEFAKKHYGGIFLDLSANSNPHEIRYVDKEGFSFVINQSAFKMFFERNKIPLAEFNGKTYPEIEFVLVHLPRCQDIDGYLMPYCGGRTIFIYANFNLIDYGYLLKLNSVIHHELVHIKQAYNDWINNPRERPGPNTSGYWSSHLWIERQENKDQANFEANQYLDALKQGEELMYFAYLPSTSQFPKPTDPEQFNDYWTFQNGPLFLEQGELI